MVAPTLRARKGGTVERRLSGRAGQGRKAERLSVYGVAAAEKSKCFKKWAAAE